MRTLLLIALLVSGAAARDGAGGTVRWGRDVDRAVAESERTGWPLLLYFTHDDAPHDRAFDAGPLSDERVVAAADPLIRVLVDCTGSTGFVRANRAAVALMERYGVGRLPALLVLTPDGKVAGGLQGGGDSARVLACLRDAQAPLAPSLKLDGFEFLGRNATGHEEYRCRRDGAVMVLVPGGTTVAGPKGERRERVAAFLIDRTEVTNARFRAFLAAVGWSRPKPLYGPSWLADPLPVTGVSWEEAARYAKWCGKRLPRRRSGSGPPGATTGVRSRGAPSGDRGSTTTVAIRSRTRSTRRNPRDTPSGTSAPTA